MWSPGYRNRGLAVGLNLQYPYSADSRMTPHTGAQAAPLPPIPLPRLLKWESNPSGAWATLELRTFHHHRLIIEIEL